MPVFAATKAQKVYLVLKDKILAGDYASGAPLPGELAMANDHDISRITVRRALAQLEREGLVSRRQGVGTFATPHYAAKPILADFSDLIAARAEMGRVTTVAVRAFSYGEPPSDVRRAMKLGPAETTQYSTRLRFIKGEPFSLLRTHVPQDIGETYTAAELETHPLLTLLERAGAEPASATQLMSATLAAPEVAAALDVDLGSALIAMTRIVFDRNGRGIEYLEALYRPDRYSFQMELARTSDADGAHWTPASPQIRKPA